MALAFLNPVAAGPVADSTISVAHDCGSGDDRWLFVAVPLFSAGETPTVASVAYDGAALSPVVQGEHLYAGNTNVVRAEWWALDLVAAGKTGSANVVVTLSGAADQLSVIAFTATGSGGPSANVNTAGGNLSVVSAAITTAAATSRVVGLASWAADRGVTPGTGNTLIEDITSPTAPPNNILAWAGWEQGTGGSDTWDVTLSSAVRSAAAVMELLEAEAGGGEPDYTLEAEGSAYVLSGGDAGLRASRLLAAEAGAYALAGGDAGLLISRLLQAEGGAYAIAGGDAALLASRLLAAEPGTYSLTGSDAALLAGRLLEAAAGSYTLTGNDAALIYTPLGGPTYTLVAEPGSYSLTGNDAALLASRLLTAEAGAYALVGNAATLVYSGAEIPVTPDSRVFVVAAESRVYVIVLDDRTLEVPAESRTYAIRS